VIDVEQAMACIEKGQQLAGHFPNAEALSLARRTLTAELSSEESEAELHAGLARIVERERAALNGRG
jgi:uncharacterized membrane protein YgcG